MVSVELPCRRHARAELWAARYARRVASRAGLSAHRWRLTALSSSVAGRCVHSDRWPTRHRLASTAPTAGTGPLAHRIRVWRVSRAANSARTDPLVCRAPAPREITVG